ncbi:acyl-CoA dehydrogenase [Streptomyces sp. AK04-3B]|uniref:acyl-CoA dehydrogenase n=1 Tax=Streptomyces sp. AK04-3B TaxID=3028650 RepID=UPI0029B617FF|nr:acyl-CoA dehydrogenase [Streptomyces sp. AK04-3B]MDX3803493.1 acyl-CoA dehydrogenase [Streptomyces sp. AK04-3B]
MVNALTTAPRPPARPAAGEDRAAQLEKRFGDPAAPGNPVGYAALLSADRRAALSADAEDLLDDFGMHLEYVPRALGGRFTCAETLLRVMRPVFRRDVSLGMGYGMSTFMAASDVWMAGSRRQRDWLARLLIGRSKAAIAQHETAHTNDFVRSQVRAVHADGRLRVTGAKTIVNNARRADALVLFCRTDDRVGSGSHSALLLDPRTLPADRYRAGSRRPSVGLRGAHLDSIDFDDCPLPEDALLGPAGSGVPTALRSFQVSRTLTAAMVAAAVDTSLRTAVLVDRIQGPGDGGLSPMDPEATAATLANSFVNLLFYDCLAVVATRALHLYPAETSVYSAAVKALLPRVLSETMYDLATVLGSQIYTRAGTIGVFQKHIRDVPVISLGHAGTVACQATIIPQLPSLARGWFSGEPAGPGLFRPAAPLPPFDYTALVLASGRDSLSATLIETAAALPARNPVERALRALAGQFVDELDDLRARILALPPVNEHTPVRPAWFALTDRYVLVLAAAAVLGVWRHSRDDLDPFLADPAWATAALHRIARRLGAPAADLPPECMARVHQEVLARFGDRRSYDLYNTPLPG